MIKKISIGNEFFLKICYAFILISNPIYWPSQIQRHIDPSLIITPNAPAVQHLNDSTQYWTYLNNTKGINESFYKTLTDYQKVHLVESYILDLIQYLNIQYIWYVIDYVATPTEVLEKGVGDCQHITVVMVSFLIYLGYNAYCAECPLHWYPVVFLNNGSVVSLYRVNWTDPQILINDKEIIFQMNLFQRLYDTMTHFSINRPVSQFMDTSLFWILFIPLSFVISSSLILIIRTSGTPTRKKKIYNILFGGLVLIFGFLFIYFISNLWYQYTMFSIIVLIVLTVQLISHNFFIFRKSDVKQDQT